MEKRNKCFSPGGLHNDFSFLKKADSLLPGSNFLIVLSILLAVVCLVVLWCGMGYGVLKCAVLWRAGVGCTVFCGCGVLSVLCC